jgi:hypothetical protein
MRVSTLTTPCDKNVTAACKKFDRENRTIEESLTALFRQYPHNTDPHHVLLKVIALNALYSTRIPVYSEKIPNALDMTHHIHQHGPEIDSALASGSTEIVDQIANLRVPKKGQRCYFSFASKYCSWQKPQSYPIWDSNVQAYLRCLQRQTGFAKKLRRGWILEIPRIPCTDERFPQTVSSRLVHF